MQRGELCVKAIVGYCQPMPWHRHQYDAWAASVRTPFDWIDGEISLTPARCTPLLCIDLNDGMGRINGQERCDVAVGPFEMKDEHLPGILMHKLLLKHKLSAVNTHYDCGHTRKGRIDYIGIPSGAMPLVEKCEVWRKVGRRMQYSKEFPDHSPLVVRLEIPMPTPTRSSPQL